MNTVLRLNRTVLEAYSSPSAAKIAPNFKDAEGYWTGVTVGYLGFICDKRWFEDHLGVAYTESWYDLLKPEFKG